MIHTSKAYKEMIAGNMGNREFCIRDTITFADGRKLQLSLDDVIAYTINDATTESGKFQVGAAIIKEYSITLGNFDGKFNGYVFEGANITADIGLKLADGSWEILRKGVFRIVKAVGVETISITAYDSMLFFDRPYSESKLQYPATLLDIIRDACTCCQMTFDASTVDYGAYKVAERPNDNALTFRDVISYAAQIMGCYARIDRLDKLQFSWYALDYHTAQWGGIFDKDTPYSSGDDINGGTFSPWNTGYVVDRNFEELINAHHVHDLKSKDINTEDITITGVKVRGKKEGSEEAPEEVFGDEGYMIVIENNPFIVSENDAFLVVMHTGTKLHRKTFRPMTISAQSDPAIEAGDIAWVSYSDQSQAVRTAITNTTFSLGGSQSISCSAETPTEKNYTKYSAQTKIIEKANQETDQRLDAYDLAVQNMNQLAANTMGFYATTVKQADGSILSYRHDKPKLSESKIVYKSGIDGFWVTENYRGTDAATTWKAGFDSNGNAVLNMLSVIGINFDWAHGGTLTLGGKGNGNGLLKILNADGTQIGYIDNTGVHFNEGTFSGSLRAADFSGSKIKGSKFITEKQDNSGYMNVEQGNITFYQEADLNYDDYAGSISPVISRLTDALVYVGGEYVLISGDAYLAGIGVNGFYSVDIGIQGRSEINITRDRVLIPRTLTVGNISANSVSTGGLSCSQKANLAGGFNSRQSSGVTGNLDVTKEVRAKDFVKNININSANYNNPDLREIYVGRSAMPVCEDIGTGVTNELGIAFVDIDPVFLAAVNTDLEYQVFLQKEGQGDLWVDSKESAYFIVKGSANLKFSWSIKCTEINSENKRMEEVDLQNEENSKIEQYDAEIESLKTAMLKEYDDDIEFNLKQEVYMINKEEEALLNESYQNYQYHESRR